MVNIDILKQHCNSMPSVVALSFMVLSSIIFSITLIIVCGKRKLYQRKECSRRDPHVPGQEAQKVIEFLFLSLYVPLKNTINNCLFIS